MKAVIVRRYGSPDVLKVEEVDKPTVPDDGVLVRNHSSSINPADFFTMSRVSYLMRTRAGLKPRPAILGIDFAGRVESVGKGVRDFKPGDPVFGGRRDAFAEYVCVPEKSAIVRKPEGVPFEAAGAVGVAALTALQALRDHGRVQPGQKVLINGASGGVGTFAVQLAREFGAEVTAVCGSRNAHTVGALGARKVVDYTKEDFIQTGERYDLALDIAGSRPWSQFRIVLKPKATFVLVGASANTVHGAGRSLQHLAGIRLASIRSGPRVVFFIAKLKKADLQTIAGLMAAGKVKTVIDRSYELSDVATAYHYMGEGHAKGKIVIKVSPS